MPKPADIEGLPWAYAPSVNWTTKAVRDDLKAWIAAELAARPYVATWALEEHRPFNTRDLSRDQPQPRQPYVILRLTRDDGTVLELSQHFDLMMREDPAVRQLRLGLLSSTLTGYNLRVEAGEGYETAVAAPGGGLTGSAALQAAIDTSPEGAGLRLAPGALYELNAEVWPKDGQRFLGSPGAVIKRAPFRIRLDERTGVGFEGVTFDLNVGSNFDEVVRGTDCSDITFRRCTWVNSGIFNPEWTIHAALLNDNVFDVLVEDCTINEGQLNIGRLNGGRVIVRRCVFDRPMQYGLSYVTAGSGTLTDLLVEDCVCKRMATSGFIYVGDDVGSDVSGIVSRIDNVILRRIRVDDVLDDGGVSRSINLRPHNGDNWLVEGIEVFQRQVLQPTTIGVLVAPRRDGGVQSNFTFRDIHCRGLSRPFSMTDSEGDLSIAGLTLENIQPRVLDGAATSSVSALLAKYGSP